MSCTPTNYPSTDSPLATTAAPVPGSGSNLTGPYLVVSNHPETLTSANVQLYKCEIPLAASTPQRIRVFVWHVASSSGNTFTMAAKLGSGTGTISNFVGQVEDQGGTYEACGICCAEAMLYNSYDSSFSNVSLSSTEAAVWTDSLPANRLLGAVFEFDVESSSSTTLYLRTYVGSVAETTTPATDSARHVRGWWPYSEATFAVSGTVDTNTAAPPSTGAVWCPIEETHNSSGTKIVPPELDPSVFGHRSSDTYGWPLPDLPNNLPLGGNVGLYGAIVKYVFTVSNSSTTSQHAAYMEIYGRNNGGSVYGAAQIISPSGYPDWVVPGLAWISGTATGRKLTQKSTGAAPVMVPANTSSMTTTVKFTAGGASSLPGNLLLKAIRESAG